MENNIEFEYNFQSYPLVSPGYLKCKLPQLTIDELKESIVNVLELEEKPPDLDCRGKLAGNISEEYNLEITPRIKYLTESLAKEYFEVFGSQKPNCFSDDLNQKNCKYKLNMLWVNVQKKNEFNPIHDHGGIFSFVIWVKIPYDLNKELEIYKKSNNSSASLFSFVYANPYGRMCSENLNVDKTWEWEMVFFPSNLSHVVYPFFTTDESRISISGNVYYDVVPNEN